jgi:hypothetical protein
VVHLLQRYRNTWKESNTGFKVSCPVTVITNPPYCKTQKMLGYNTATATATKSKEKLDQKKYVNTIHPTVLFNIIHIFSLQLKT